MKIAYFSASRQVFKGPSTSQPGGVEVQPDTEAQKSPEKMTTQEREELRKKAVEGKKLAQAEKDNIERQYGKPDANGNLSELTPLAIREQYRKLNETLAGLDASLEKEAGIVQDSLKKLGEITGALDTYAERSKKEAASGDPMALSPYERHPKPKAEAPEPKKEAEPGKQAAPAPAPKEATAEEPEQRILNGFCARFEEGSNKVTAEEAAFFRSNIDPNGYYMHDVPATDEKPGHSYEIEISKDKKWIRVTSFAEEKEGEPKGKYTGVLPLEEGLEGKPEFALATREEAAKKELDKNKEEARNNLEWLKTDEAPLGSSLILFTKIETRKNYESGKDERFMQSYAVRKGVTGLRFATLEVPIDENGNSLGPVKEVRSDKDYSDEKALALVNKEVIYSEGAEEDKHAEVRRALNDLGHNLIAQLPFGGEASPNFQNTLRELRAMLTKFDVSRWSYKDHIIGNLTEYEDGTLTIYDPDEKNPKYVSKEKTPDEPKYAITQGPIDMSKYA